VGLLARLIDSPRVRRRLAQFLQGLRDPGVVVLAGFDATALLAAFPARRPMDATDVEPRGAVSRVARLPGLALCETAKGTRWRFVFRQSDGTLSTRRGFSNRAINELQLQRDRERRCDWGLGH